MSLTTIVGALLAVVARPKPRLTPVIDPELDRHVIKAQDREIEHLRRSHARLIDHIERLERELAMTQELLAHWRDEAARIARDNRDRRERAMLAGTHSYELAQYTAAMAQQAQQCAFDQQSVYQGFCNCVPSRTQVWGAPHGLVQQLNDNTVKERD